MSYWYVIFLVCLVSAIFIAAFLLADFYYSIIQFFFGEEVKKLSRTRFAISATIVLSLFLAAVYLFIVKVVPNF